LKFKQKSDLLNTLRSEKMEIEKRPKRPKETKKDQNILKNPPKEKRKIKSRYEKADTTVSKLTRLNSSFLVFSLICLFFCGARAQNIVCPRENGGFAQSSIIEIPGVYSSCDISDKLLSTTFVGNIALFKLNFPPKYQKVHRCYFKKQIVCRAVDPQGIRLYNYNIIQINGSDVSTCIEARDEQIDVPNNNFRVIHRNRLQFCYQVSDFFIEEGTIVSYDGINVHSNLTDLTSCAADKGFCVLEKGTFIWNRNYFLPSCDYRLVGVYPGKFNRGFVVTDHNQGAYRIGKMYQHCSPLETYFRTREGFLIQIKFLNQINNTVENISTNGHSKKSVSEIQESGSNISKFDIDNFRKLYFSNCEHRIKRYNSIYNSVR